MLYQNIMKIIMFFILVILLAISIDIGHISNTLEELVNIIKNQNITPIAPEPNPRAHKVSDKPKPGSDG